MALRSLGIFLPLATVVIGSSLAVINVHDRHHSDLLVTSERRVLEACNRELARKLATCSSDLEVLVAHRELQAFLESGNETRREALAQEFLAFSRSKRTYSQVRFIDETGLEIVRVNRSGEDSVLVPRAKLQHKDGRYYFAAVNTLAAGEIYESPLDLNLERGRLDASVTPVLRLGTPIFDGTGRRRGMMLLNCASEDLAAIVLQREYCGQVQLLDSRGFRLIGSGPEALGTLVADGERVSLAQVSPETWNRIAAVDEGRFVSPTGGIHLFITGHAGWKIVSYLSPAVLRADLIGSRSAWFAAGGMTLALLALASWLLASNWSRRKHAEEELRWSEVRHASVLDTAAEGVICTDSAGTIVLFNSAAEAMFGRDRQSVVGQSIGLLMPESAPPFEVTLDGWKEENGIREAMSLEVTGRRGDGSLFPMALAISQASSRAGTFFTGMVSDLTRRKTLEARLFRARKLESVNRLAVGIAHEINTPLQYVRDNTQFLEQAFGKIASLLERTEELAAAEEGDAGSGLRQELAAALEQADVEFLRDEVPKAIHQSLEGAGQVAEIVRGIMKFAPPLVSELVSTDLREAIENTITVTAHDWKHVAEMETDFDPDLPPVPCLPSEFNHVILNMILNAAHAIAQRSGNGPEHKGTIAIRTRRDGDQAEIRISDTGTGIPEDLGERIFDHFFTSQDTGQARGLGLSMAHGIIVDLHGGTIDFETELGRGTTFIIRLPLESRTPSEASGALRDPLPGAARVGREAS